VSAFIPPQYQFSRRQAPSHKRSIAFRLLLVVLVCIGILSRGWRLDQKIYWHDEAFTSLVITGQPGRYFNEAIFRNQIVSPTEVLKFQQLQPHLGFQESLLRQGEEDSQHPPLYYMLLRLWVQIWGTSVAAMRSFSVLGSLLVFPAVYWLGLELFGSHRAAGVALALIAVSPLQLVYAQEAREYALWMGMMLGGSALLLQASRLGHWRSWLAYGLLMLVGIYTALFTLLVGFGHGLYLLVNRQDRWRNVGHYVITWLGVGIGFSPWLWVMGKAAQRVGDSTSWASVPLPLETALRMHFANYSRAFVDFNLGFGTLTLRWPDQLALLIAAPILLLQLVALVWLWRQAPHRIRWFLMALIAGTVLPLGLRDTFRGGQLATVTRYLFPSFLGLQLIVVYWLTTYRHTRWQRRLTNGVFAGLIVLGLASGMVYSQTNTWWNKVLNANYPQLAQIINQSPQPLVLSDIFTYNPSSVLSLSYRLKSEARLLLMPAVGNTMPIADLPSQAQQIFFLNLPEGFRQKFAVRFKNRLQGPLRNVFQDPWNQVWQADLRPITLESSPKTSPNPATPAAQQPRERAKMSSV
jgi:uncharacterized membrane protein